MNIQINEMQKAILLDALDFKLQSVKRSRNQQVVGSKMHVAISETYQDIDKLVDLVEASK